MRNLPDTAERSGPRGVTILGSTGSVGCSTIDLLDREPAAYDVIALTANANVELLADQAKRLRPRLAVTADIGRYGELKRLLAGTGVEAAAGAQAIVDAASLGAADFVMSAIVGAAGLAPTLAAVRRGATVGLANKESLVCAGDLLMAEVARSGATLLPVDSEHNALYQVFDFDRPGGVEKLTLTASGGPFRTRSLAAMADVTAAEAVDHPNWDMGAKISVDSATMMNKGLELIEAFHLFPVAESQIDILVHPQSVVHSLVTYVDGSVLAQLGSPDMRTPIAYALAWPARMAAPVPKLDLAAVRELTFETQDPDRFPALSLARLALKTGQGATTILNAANEVAVHCFLTGRIGFLDIARIVEQTLEALDGGTPTDLDHIHSLDREARRRAAELTGCDDPEIMVTV